MTLPTPIRPLLLAIAIAACGGRASIDPSDAGPPQRGQPDADAAPSDTSSHDSAVAPPPPLAHPVVAWVAALDVSAGIPYVASSDDAGGVYVGTYDGAVIRVGAQGTPLWTTRMATLWNGRTFLGGIATDARGNVVVAGDGLTLLDAADGHPLWSVAFEGTLDTRGAAVLSDGTVIHVGFLGGTATFGSTTLVQPASQPGWAGFLVRCDADGSALSASLLSDLAPGDDGVFHAGTDENGDLVLVVRKADQTLAAITFDRAMHPLRTVPLNDMIGNDYIANAPGGAVYISSTDLTANVQRVAKIDPSGATAWVFHPPPSYVIPSALTNVTPDGPNGALAWVDTLWSLDAAGKGTELVPKATLDAAIAGAIGRPGWVADQSFGAKLVADVSRAVFVVGDAEATSTGGGLAAPFVAKVQR